VILLGVQPENTEWGLSLSQSQRQWTNCPRGVGTSVRLARVFVVAELITGIDACFAMTTIVSCENVRSTTTFTQRSRLWAVTQRFASAQTRGSLIYENNVPPKLLIADSNVRRVHKDGLSKKSTTCLPARAPRNSAGCAFMTEASSSTYDLSGEDTGVQRVILEQEVPGSGTDVKPGDSTIKRLRRRSRSESPQVVVYALGGFASFVDGPHYERLAAAHVARYEGSRNRGHVVCFCRDVPALVQLCSEFGKEAVLDGAREAHCQKNEVAFKEELGVSDRFEPRRRPHSSGSQTCDVTGFAEKRCCGYAPVAHSAFFVRTFGAQLHWP
jgi:hypothetical protein